MTKAACIGVDVGQARVGVAVSEDGRLAVPHATLPAADAPARIVELMANLETALVVLGWPLELSGREGLATRRVEQFIERLEAAAETLGHEIEVHLRDERLTTGLADVLLDDAGIRGRKRKDVVDQVAATQILQAFLDEDQGRGAQES